MALKEIMMLICVYEYMLCVVVVMLGSSASSLIIVVFVFLYSVLFEYEG